jgi:hypothetical protein
MLPSHVPLLHSCIPPIDRNAKGNRKPKALLVYRSQNAQALKNTVKFLPTVIWELYKKARITTQIFSQWFAEYFLPEIKKIYIV